MSKSTPSPELLGILARWGIRGATLPRDGEALALLEQIADDTRAIREMLERGRGAQPQADAAGLLRAIRASVGDSVFTCSELAAHAALPAAADLQAAIVAVAGAANPRKLGKLLRKLEGRDLGGLEVHRVGTDRDGLNWMVASLRV